MTKAWWAPEDCLPVQVKVEVRGVARILQQARLRVAAVVSLAQRFAAGRKPVEEAVVVGRRAALGEARVVAQHRQQPVVPVPQLRMQLLEAGDGGPLRGGLGAARLQQAGQQGAQAGGRDVGHDAVLRLFGPDRAGDGPACKLPVGVARKAPGPARGDRAGRHAAAGSSAAFAHYGGCRAPLIHGTTCCHAARRYRALAS